MHERDEEDQQANQRRVRARLEVCEADPDLLEWQAYFEAEGRSESTSRPVPKVGINDLRVCDTPPVRLICEAFSPERLTAMVSRMGFERGRALDLSAPCPVTGRRWDLSDEKDQKLAKKLVKESKPYFLMLSPPCTIFSIM